MPQGAVLAPMLFNIMLHDLPADHAGMDIVSYADITLIVRWQSLLDSKKYAGLFKYFVNVVQKEVIYIECK